jgi:predicted GNAT family N-acyltransferase
MPEIEIDVADGTKDLADALGIRHDVFCVEQGVPEHEEMDGLDGGARHYLVRRDGLPVGTARVRALGGRTYKIERVAIRRPARRAGLGRALMLRLIDDIARAGGSQVVLNAQLAVREFYIGLGFSAVGDIFEEAGIPHIKMCRKLDKARPHATLTDS